MVGDTSLLTVLLAAIAIATILNVLLKRINMPTIIGYILTGSIIGMIFGIHAHGNEELEQIAEFGIVFLMFSIGLELSINELKVRKKELLVYGAFQVILTAGVISLIAIYLLGIAIKPAIIASLGLSLSSTAIVLKVFNETGEIKSTYGRGANGILIFQDIALIPILLLITIFTNNDKSLAALLGETALNAAITLFILFIFGKFVLRRFFMIVSASNSKEIYMGSILLIIVGSSYLAHSFGFAYTLGAFIAGVLIADTIYKYQVEADLIPFRDLLLGVFFVSIGMQINLHVVQENIILILELLVGVMLIKLIVAFVLLSIFMPNKDALKTGLSLSQIGEAALVIFSLALSSNLIEEIIVQSIIVTIVFSMILTPLILGNLNKLVKPFFKKVKIINPEFENNSLENHIILCGYGTFGQSISEKLEEEQIEHQIITSNTEHYVSARQASKDVFYGEPSDRGLLERLRVRNAMSIVIALDDFENLEHVCATVNLIDPNINIVAKTQHKSNLEKLKKFNIKTVLDANEEISLRIVKDIMKSKLLSQETKQLKYLDRYNNELPNEAIELVTYEQARLLDMISKSFNGIRLGEDILVIKVYYDTFVVLSEIIEGIIKDLMSNDSLSSDQYGKINLLLNIQNNLENANRSLRKLSETLAELDTKNSNNTFSNVVVEGLDAILLSVKDVASEFDQYDIELLKIMTSNNSKGIEKVRSAYLKGKTDFDQSGNALLLSAANLTEQLILLFGEIGENYRKLSKVNT